MKIYHVEHVRMDAENEVADQKAIGFFSSREKALEAIKSVRNKPGFRKLKNQFRVDEYQVDQMVHALNGFDPKECLFFRKTKQMRACWVLQFYRPYPHDDYYDEIRTIGFFSSKKSADSFRRTLLEKPGFRDGGKFYVGKVGIDWI